MKTNDNKILSHTTWNCKYHIVFAPKYRRKIFLRITPKRNNEYNQKFVPMEGYRNNRRRNGSRACTPIAFNTTEDECIGSDGISQRQK